MNCNIIEWLNSNSGAVNACSTIILAIATIVLVCITYFYAKKTSEMVSALKMQTQLSIDPVVVIVNKNWIDIKDFKITIKISNDGTIPVTNLELRTSLPKNKSGTFLSTLPEKYPEILEPGRSYQVEIDVSEWLKKDNYGEYSFKEPNTIFAIELTYLRVADHKRYKIYHKYEAHPQAFINKEHARALNEFGEISPDDNKAVFLS